MACSYHKEDMQKTLAYSLQTDGQSPWKEVILEPTTRGFAMNIDQQAPYIMHHHSLPLPSRWAMATSSNWWCSWCWGSLSPSSQIAPSRLLFITMPNTPLQWLQETLSLEFFCGILCHHAYWWKVASLVSIDFTSNNLSIHLRRTNIYLGFFCEAHLTHICSSIIVMIHILIFSLNF